MYTTYEYPTASQSMWVIVNPANEKYRWYYKTAPTANPPCPDKAGDFLIDCYGLNNQSQFVITRAAVRTLRIVVENGIALLEKSDGTWTNAKTGASASPPAGWVEPPGGGGTPTPPKPPTIANFTCAPLALPFGGGSVTVSATVTGADGLQVNGVPVAALPANIFITTAGNVVLTASNAGGATQASATVTVADKPETPTVNAYLDFGSGRVALFAEADAKDMGDYNNIVHKTCTRLTLDAFPGWQVWWRRDKDVDHLRIVVEYGDINAKMDNLYTPVTFIVASSDGQELYRASIRATYVYGRFMWQNKPERLVRTPADILAQKLLPKFSQAQLFGYKEKGGIDYRVDLSGPMGRPIVTRLNYNPPLVDSNYSTIAETTVINPNPGDPGEREEIGHIVSPAASVMNGTDNADKRGLLSCFAGAQWFSNGQFHMREADGSMLALDAGTWASTDQIPAANVTRRINYQYTNGHQFNADATIVRNNAATWEVAGKANTTTYVDIWTGGGEAHWPAWPVLPWLLTDDPYYLEEIQMSLNWRVLNNGTGRYNEKLPLLARITQTRALAWTLRDQFIAVRSTPDNVPKWLANKTYMKAMLNDHLTLAMRFVNHPAKMIQTFRAWPQSTWFESWMQNWLNGAIGLAVAHMDFAEWRPVFEWTFGFNRNFGDASTGWRIEWCCPYMTSPLNLQTTDNTKVNYYGSALFTNQPVYPSLIKASDYDPYTRADMNELWNAYASGDKYPAQTFQLSDKEVQSSQPSWHLDVTEPAWDGNSLIQDNYVANAHVDNASSGTFFYFTNWLHYLVPVTMAKALGLAGADAIYTRMMDQIPKRYAAYGPGKAKHYGRPNFSFDP